MDYGYSTLLTPTAFGPRVSADGLPEMKTGGITIDWGTVAANGGADLTYLDGTVLKSGQKGLRLGQVMTKIANAGAFTITMTGGPTGGTFTITGTNPLTGLVATQTVAFNASVANVQTAMDAIYGAGNTVVTGAGALPANVHTVTQAAALLGWPIATPTANGALLTGGTTPAVAVAVTQAGQSTGKFGPYDPAATDGRATLARSNAVILDTSILQNGPAGYTTVPTDHAAGIVGGRLWIARILQVGTGTASLAAGPTLANLEAVFPRAIWVRQS